MEYTQPKLEYFLKTEKKHLKNYPYTIYYIINIVNIVLRGNIQEIVKKETCSMDDFPTAMEIGNYSLVIGSEKRFQFNMHSSLYFNVDKLFLNRWQIDQSLR